MLNQFVVVGRIKDMVQKQNNKTDVIVEVPRNFKNELGKYDTDTLVFEVSGVISNSTVEHCKIQDVVGIKGRIQSGETIKLVAEKVTFLSSSKSDK